MSVRYKRRRRDIVWDGQTERNDRKQTHLHGIQCNISFWRKITALPGQRWLKSLFKVSWNSVSQIESPFAYIERSLPIDETTAARSSSHKGGRAEGQDWCLPALTWWKWFKVCLLRRLACSRRKGKAHQHFLYLIPDTTCSVGLLLAHFNLLYMEIDGTAWEKWDGDIFARLRCVPLRINTGRRTLADLKIKYSLLFWWVVKCDGAVRNSTFQWFVLPISAYIAVQMVGKVF